MIANMSEPPRETRDATGAILGTTGWSLVATTAITLIVLLTVISVSAPGAQQAAHLAIRSTARLSVALFLLAFTASATWQFWSCAFTGWQRRNRRYLGVSFALSHFTHLRTILSLRVVAPAELAAIPTSTWLLGGLAYLFIAAMTATSFDRTAKAIGLMGLLPIAMGLHKLYALWRGDIDDEASMTHPDARRALAISYRLRWLRLRMAVTTSGHTRRSSH